MQNHQGQIFPRVPVPKGMDSDTTPTVLTYMIRYNTILESVTVLVPLITEEGEVWLAADGCVSSDDGGREEYALKTARVNDYLAVGIAGSYGYGGQIVAQICGEPELAKLVSRVDVFKILEKENAPRSGKFYEKAKDDITATLNAWRSGLSAEGKDLNVVLAGIASDGPRFCVWHCGLNWKEEEYPNAARRWEPGMEFGFPFGPVNYRPAANVLGETSKPPKKRIKECIRLFAKKCPEAVNSKIVYRRSKDGFRLDPPDWPGVESAKWPTDCPHGSTTTIDTAARLQRGA